jgi:phosphatidylglycerophosphatase A
LGPLPFTSWCAFHPNHPHLWLFRQLMEVPFLAAIALLTWVAVRASDLVVQETGHKDPGYIVVDEWVGVWIALWPVRWTLALSFGQALKPGGALLLTLVLGVPFLAFRVLDIWKPWPVFQLQDLPDGQGIVADDLVAGLYAIPLVMLLVPAAGVPSAVAS